MSAGTALQRRVWLLALGFFLMVSVAGHAQTPPAAFPGDPLRGKTLYQNCTACHSIDDDDIGPRHRGVVGRPAGTVPGYAYSPALKASGIVWDKATLDRWLTNPTAMVPGTKMFFLIDNPQNRADIIAYLSELR
jgi:cytochrome c